MKLKPLTSLRKHKLRGLVAAGVMVAGVSSLVVTQTTPALADPTQTLVAVGSDTIQDIYNQFAVDLGGNELGSYNATNPVTGGQNEVITPVDGTAGVNCSFARPDGSGPGQGALEQSIGQPEAGGTAPLPQAGCVDIARSSSAPAAVGSGIGSGSYTGANALQFVPFALDAVAGAIGPATGGQSFTAESGDANGDTLPATTVATQLPAAVADFTQADLTTLYDNCGTVTEGGITFWPFQAGTQPANTQRIDLYIPQLGSGTEKFWAKETGNWTATSPSACANNVIINGALAKTATQTLSFSVEEHDGTDVATDPLGYTPFSIAQWISQSHSISNGGTVNTTDRRHGAALQEIGGQQPLTGTGHLNTSFPFTRDVFSVVSLARLQNPSDPLFTLLNGTNSTLCQDSGEISNYGFATLGAACGSITAANTAQP